jgi:hypothetical protein
MEPDVGAAEQDSALMNLSEHSQRGPRQRAQLERIRHRDNLIIAEFQPFFAMALIMDEAGAVGLFTKFELAVRYREEGIVLSQRIHEFKPPGFRELLRECNMRQGKFCFYISHRLPAMGVL